MKISHILGTAVVVIILLATTLAVMAFHQPAAASTSPLASSLAIQATVQPADTDLSEVGSTDGIVIMGYVIVAIISIPLMFRKKKK